MQYNESNFFYLKETSLKKYYDELLKAECLYEKFPKITDMIIRKVIEVFLKDIAEEQGIESYISIWKLLKNIKLKDKNLFPKDIYNYIEIILANGYGSSFLIDSNKKVLKETIELLEMMHNILCWYLNKRKERIMVSINDISFTQPNTMEYMEKQIIKINDDIILKNNQINNLRQKIFELADEGKNISELNRIIIAIKEEKSQLEDVQETLKIRVGVQKKYVLEMEKDYKNYIKKCDDIRELCSESQKLLYEKESQLVNFEIQNQELKNLIEELDDEDESIKEMESHIDEELKILRKTYENLFDFTIEYQDILETAEFSYDDELKKLLAAKKNNIKIKMNFEDSVFSENIISYIQNISEIKRKVIIFKELVNERMKKQIKYDLFYRGFLGLKSRELKIMYSIFNITTNLINKPKELFAKSNEDKILESINNKFMEIKDINDDEIKLIFYYKLMKLSKVSIGSIKRKKYFIENLDSMVDKSYDILMVKKEFNGGIKKLDSIVGYQLEKFVLFFIGKGSNQFIDEELVIKIYNKIVELKHKSEHIKKIYNEKFDLNLMTEIEIKTSIKSHLSTFLLVLIDLGDINSYKEILEIIFETYNRLNKKINRHEKNASVARFSIEYFSILLFMANENSFLNYREEEEILPLLVAQIIIASLFLSNDDNVVLESYNNMFILWKKKQQNYNDVIIKKEDQDEILRELMEERKESEKKYENWIKNHDMLTESYKSYEEEFKKIILSSNKRIFLPSYTRYEELQSQKEKAEKNINRSKVRLGTLKSMVSPSIWKEQASKLINGYNLEDTEKLLIEEAKKQAYFKKEYSVFLDLERKIERTTELIEESKRDIQLKDSVINDVKTRITELENKLNVIKDIYIDIEKL